jgi:hypothetical protein
LVVVVVVVVVVVLELWYWRLLKSAAGEPKRWYARVELRVQL